ncbi:MAG: hypothetical protein KDB14_20580 [Planctomycetales bacterium]|nr:hypothetical protein [Planctomycetales bacterium]
MQLEQPSQPQVGWQQELQHELQLLRQARRAFIFDFNRAKKPGCLQQHGSQHTVQFDSQPQEGSHPQLPASTGAAPPVIARIIPIVSTARIVTSSVCLERFENGEFESRDAIGERVDRKGLAAFEFQTGTFQHAARRLGHA